MKYAVQVLRVLEVEVEADDDFQAEKEARRSLNLTGNEIDLNVQTADECDGGALANEDNDFNWDYAKQHFHTLDSDWVFSDD